MGTSDIVVLSIFGAVSIILPVVAMMIVRGKRKPTGGAGVHKKHRRK